MRMGYALAGDMLLRWSLGLVLSLLAHMGVVAIGLAVGARGFTGPVEIEIAGVTTEEVKDLPLGGPQSGEGKARAPARARNRASQPPADGTMAERPGKDTKTAGSTPTDDDAGPAPTSDLGAYAPQVTPRVNARERRVNGPRRPSTTPTRPRSSTRRGQCGARW